MGILSSVVSLTRYLADKILTGRIKKDGFEGKILNSDEYYDYMSKDGISGTEVEIRAFNDIYHTNVRLKNKISGEELLFYNPKYDEEVTLLSPGNDNLGHFDIIISENTKLLHKNISHEEEQRNESSRQSEGNEIQSH
ncbi:hypothetical protein QAD02_002673 [Eretmocerus hayati]|uniref:Uncharacterized protein n=1 Tax=Eretmocerus hayati TaxID=131215 RepID=A0ACC2NJW1_9HYME|nr:hypothetical protein QAD02_002673 [Eretmocerus hayati]